PQPNARPLPAGVRPPVAFHHVAPGGYVTAPNQFGPRPLPPGARVGVPKPGYRTGQQGGQQRGRVGPGSSGGRIIVATSPRPMLKVTPSAKRIHEQSEEEILRTTHRPIVTETLVPATTRTTAGRAEIISTTPFTPSHEKIDFTSGDDGNFGVTPGQTLVPVASEGPNQGVPSSTLAPFPPDVEGPTGGFTSGPRDGGSGQGRERFEGSNGDFLAPEGPRGGEFGGSESSFNDGGDLPDGFDNSGSRVPGHQRVTGNSGQ
ncbi:hypothetical protein PFISCL1PPCAC_2926, partial [Pristionchus fissidentatus]